MIEENKIQTFVETNRRIDIDRDQQVEYVKQGFNQFIDKYMLLYGRIMEIDTEEELVFKEPGFLSRIKSFFTSTNSRIYTGYQRIHEFVLKAEHVSGIDKAKIAEALLITGQGEDKSDFFEKLAEKLNVHKSNPDKVEEIEG